MTKPVSQPDLEFRDDVLLCRLIPQELVIRLNIINLSEAPITIDWDQVRLIDPDGLSHPVLHSLVVLPDARRRHVPTFIPPQGVLIETVAPIDYVFMDVTGWQQRPIFPNTEEAMQLKDAVFGVALPVKQSDTVKTYLFELQVTEVYSEVLVK